MRKEFSTRPFIEEVQHTVLCTMAEARQASQKAWKCVGNTRCTGNHQKRVKRGGAERRRDVWNVWMQGKE